MWSVTLKKATNEDGVFAYLANLFLKGHMSSVSKKKSVE